MCHELVSNCFQLAEYIALEQTTLWKDKTKLNCLLRSGNAGVKRCSWVCKAKLTFCLSKDIHAETLNWMNFKLNVATVRNFTGKFPFKRKMKSEYLLEYTNFRDSFLPWNILSTAHQSEKSALNWTNKSSVVESSSGERKLYAVVNEQF